MNKSTLLLLGMIFVTLFSAKVFATTAVTTCQDLTSDDTYELSNDIFYTSANATGGYCIGFISASIVLDCKGHTIYSDGSVGGFTVMDILPDNGGSYEIRNCIFEGDFSGGGVQGNDLYMHNTTFLNFSGSGWSLNSESGTSSNFVLEDVNFTRVVGTPISYRGVGSCSVNLTNVYDTDTGLPLAFYNTSVNVSNAEYASLYLCNAINSNFDNITITRNAHPSLSTSAGGTLSAFGSENLTINNSNFINTSTSSFYINDYYDMNVLIQNSNWTNWSFMPLYGDFYQNNINSCNHVSLVDDYSDGYPAIFVNGGVPSYISGGDYGFIYVCNAPNTTVSDVSAGILLIFSSDNVVVNNSSIRSANLYFSFAMNVRWLNNFTLSNSYLQTSYASLYLYRVDYPTIFNNILNLETTDVSTEPILQRYSNNGNFYNNIIKRSSSKSFYSASGSSGNNFNNTIGGNYWTNELFNDFSDTCTDTSPADGICDSSFNFYGSLYDYMPLSVMPLLSFTLPCTNNTYRCSGSGREVCIDDNWTFVENCTYGCGSGVCNSPPILLLNVTILINVSQFVTPYTIVKDNVSSVVQYSGLDKVINLILTQYHVYSINITGNQIYPFLGYFNATANGTLTATPTSTLSGTGNLLSDLGVGIGSFISGFSFALFDLLVYLAIIMGVLSMVYAIAYAIGRFTQEHSTA